jgi:nucleoid DNA-binding protein/uncharacterized protein (DUF433 family)
MKKRELSNAVAPKVQLSARLVRRVIQATMDTIGDTLAQTGRLEYRDLGIFTVESYAPRKAYIPATRQIKELPARKLIRFQPGRRLVKKVQQTHVAGVLSKQDERLLGRVTIESTRYEGKPLIRDTDVSVEFLLSLLVQGQTPAQILKAHPALTPEDLRACLVYAYQAIAREP